MSCAIECKNVSFSYGEKVILDNANVTFDYGKVTLLSGQSGEGKSTLLYIVSGVIPNIIKGDIQGDVLIDGVSILGKRLGELCKKVGIVLQNADEQIVQKSVEDEIAFGCENIGTPPDAIDKRIGMVTDLLSLDRTWENRKLSGGQKQRLITASTLAMGQKIILLDEPLANLDKQGANLLMSTLKDCASVGYAVIVCEHRLDMVLDYVDDVWHLSGGKLSKITDKNEHLISQSVKIKDNTLNVESKQGNLLIDCKNIAFKVKDREILKDINLTINRGERLLILGENGCGKTTLLRIIAKLNRATGGEVTQAIVNGKGKPNKKWFKNVGVVYQNPDYQLFMTSVQKEIEYGAYSKEYAQELIKLFKLEHLVDRHPQSLSEGQKRRVSIAAVLATKPSVLLLDEPTVGQDYNGLCDMVEIINDIHIKTNNTIITITHDIRCAESLCDRAVVIENGVITQQGGKSLVRKYFGI